MTRPGAASDTFRTFPEVASGLAAEMSLLDAVADGERGRSALIWSAAAPALVLPARFARSERFGGASAEAAASGWPVTTRPTGGGITPQGPGVVNLAMAFRPAASRGISGGYEAICGPLVAAFAHLGLRAATGAVAGSFCDGDYNLEIDGRKIVGTAQRWRRGAVLAHALVLIDIDLDAAVGAAGRLAAGLKLGDTYRTEAHVTLAGLLPGREAATADFLSALTAHLSGEGFDFADATG